MTTFRNIPAPRGWLPVRLRIGLAGVIALSLFAGCGRNSPASAPAPRSSQKSPPAGQSNQPAPGENDAAAAAPAREAGNETQVQSQSPRTGAQRDRPLAPKIYRLSDPPPRHDDEELARVGIHKYTSKRLTLYSDIAPEKARPLPALLDQAYDAWVEYFGALPPDREGSEFVMTGYLIGEKSLFRETGLLPEDLPPFPHGRNKGTRFWINDQPTDYYRRHLMIHEGTHCFMTAVPNPLVTTLWYMEGMAELFGTHRIDPDGTAHFRVLPHDREEFANLGRIRLIEDERRSGPPRSLAAVMELASNDYHTTAAYAWSWGLCQFLDGHPRYHDRFRKFGRSITAGEASDEPQSLFTTGRADLEEEWLLFAADLCHGYDQTRAAIEFRAGKPPRDESPSSVLVAADRGWQSSGVLLEAGRTYHVSATGRFAIAHARDRSDADDSAGTNDTSTGQGFRQPWESEPQGISIQYHAGRPLGMLIGAIRSVPRPSEPPGTTLLEVIPLGRDRTFTARVSGTLYLRLNDDWNALADNAGEIEVRIEAERGSP